MRIEELNEETIVPAITHHIKGQIDGVVIGVPRCSSVFVGYNNDGKFNKQYCIDHNVKLLDFGNEGGVIVVNKGDFDIGHFSHNTENKVNFEFAEVLKNYLISKGLNAKFNGNDLMIDDKYKCGSFSSRRYGNILYSAFHISIGMDLDLIKNICTKPMVKIPKGLGDYGITTNEIKKLYIEFIRKY